MGERCSFGTYSSYKFSFKTKERLRNEKGYVSDSAIFYCSYGNTTPPPHVFMLNRFSGKFVRTLGELGQEPGEMHYISENQFAICITTDNVDKIRKIVSESTNVKYPEKHQQLLDLMDSQEPDDNPILAIYTLK